MSIKKNKFIPANKLISVNPIKDDKGQISQLHVKSEANRERETLNVKLYILFQNQAQNHLKKN